MSYYNDKITTCKVCGKEMTCNSLNKKKCFDCRQDANRKSTLKRGIERREALKRLQSSSATPLFNNI